MVDLAASASGLALLVRLPHQKIFHPTLLLKYETKQQYPRLPFQMKIFRYENVPAKTEAEGARGVHVRWLITDETGAPNFVMRHFEIDPGGFSPLHSHSWEHEVFILEGEGTITSKDGKHPLRSGDVIFIAPGEEHQLTNTGRRTLKFLCMIPNIPKEDR